MHGVPLLARVRLILLPIFLTILLLSAALPCRAADNRLRVVFTSWIPYTYLEAGQPAGFEVEILQAVLAGMGLQVEFTVYPWKRCLAALRNGEADALVSMLMTADREEYTLYPEEHISISRTVFFTRAESHITFFGSYDKLAGYSIGTIAGFSYGPAFDQATYLRKEEVLDAGMLIRKVLGGRNDLAAENQAVVIATAKAMGVLERLRFLEPPIHTQKLYVGFAKVKGLQDLCRDFSRALGEFKKTETYRAILAKYGVDFCGMID